MAYFELDGKKLYYEVHGQGEPIIMLNGVIMSTASWQMFVPAISKHNQLILLDFFDQGQSDKLVGESYTLARQVAALKGLYDHLGLKKASVVGTSYGGNTALKFASEYPDMVEKLIIFHATPKTSDWLQSIGKAWISSKDNPQNFYNTAIPVIYSPEFYNDNLEWMHQRERLLVENVFTNKDFMDAMERLTNSGNCHDVRDQLGQITAKTLVVSAEHDMLTPKEDQQFIVKNIKNAELVHLPDSGHASMYEKPTLYVSLILGFVNADFNGL